MIGTMTLTEFLMARIAEDEARDPHDFYKCDLAKDGGAETWCTCGWTERWAAEIDAKRRIVVLHQSVKPVFGRPVCMCEGKDPCPTLAALALPYADHPDFQPEWRA
jgi:hypothetical protein